MNNSTFMKGFLSLFFASFLAVNVTAQSVSVSPSGSIYAVTGVPVSIQATANGFNIFNFADYSFNWSATGGMVSGSNPVSVDWWYPQPSVTRSVTYASPGTYTVSVTVTKGSSSATSGTITIHVLAAPAAPNLWATSSDGNQVSSYTVLHGVHVNGPVNIFDPFPSSSSTTAALAKSQTPTQATGAFYFLPNTTGNNGVVTIYGATSTGSSIVNVGTLDLNGSSNASLGFVRIGMGPDGRGWILAGDGLTLYLARFTPSGANGLGPATIAVEDNSVTLTGTGASVANFQNGDVCMDGQGGLFALANNGFGVTQIYVGAPNGSSTSLALQWTLLDQDGNNFIGTVNGVAFDQFGSLYISTGDGLYFIDQSTVNGPAGTVQCRLVQAQTGLQDLASNYFPQQTTLPVTLLSFTASLRNDITTVLWEVENEINFSHYELERSTSSATGFTGIASKDALGSTSRSTYQHADNLTAVAGAVVYYRLKMVDIDGKYKYSNVVMVRKGERSITGITINPNPVVTGELATMRFSANGPATVAIRVVDLNGKVVLQQENKVFEGVNSVPVNNLNKLLPGNYVIQMINGVEISTVKFTVAR